MREILLLCLLGYVANVFAQPVVIAHRGASGYLPEHTLEAAVLAYAQGVDYIEQDLVLTKDGQLIVLHDIVLQTTTNVAQVFPDRAREDGQFYAIDFTLAEIKRLNKYERQDAQLQQVYPQRYRAKQGFQISTWDEQVELITELNRQFGRQVGWYPELKAPAWHAEQGQDILKIYVESLNQAGMNTKEAPVITQCFDWIATQALRQQYGLQTKLVQLIAENDWTESSTDYDALKTEEGVAQMAKIIDGIGPWLPQLYDMDSQKPTAFWSALQTTNLVVHPYTHRDDALILASSPKEQLQLIFETLKVDGVFTDQPVTTVQFLNK